MEKSWSNALVQGVLAYTRIPIGTPSDFSMAPPSGLANIRIPITMDRCRCALKSVLDWHHRIAWGLVSKELKYLLILWAYLEWNTVHNRAGGTKKPPILAFLSNLNFTSSETTSLKKPTFCEPIYTDMNGAFIWLALEKVPIIRTCTTFLGEYWCQESSRTTEFL